jgi:hypothetical protein
MLIERLGDGPPAFDRFFSLLDEYQARVPRLVATLAGMERTYTEFSKGEKRTRSFPANISLISYNAEDPGLFVSAEGSGRFPGMGFCASLDWFETLFGPCRSKLAFWTTPPMIAGRIHRLPPRLKPGRVSCRICTRPHG